MAADIGVLLADSLVLWNIQGTATHASSSTTIDCANGISLSVSAAAAAEHPVRWWISWQTLDAQARTQPCTSVLGLLRMMRGILGGDDGYRLRIAPNAEIP